MRSYIQLLRQYHSALIRGTLHQSEKEAIIGKLEDIEHECMTIGDLGQKMATRKMEELLNCRKNDWFGRKSTSQRVEKLIEENRKALELVLLANSCRVLAAQIKAALPGDRHLAQERAQNAHYEMLRVEALLRLNRDQFLAGIDGLKIREDKLLAGNGILDDDYFDGLQKRYDSVGGQASEGCKVLKDQASNTDAVANQLNRMAKDGIAITFEMDSVEGIKFLAVEPDSGK